MRMRRGSPPSIGGRRRVMPAAVDALPLVGREGVEDLLPLRVGQLVERQLVVVAHEVRPLRLGGELGRARQRLGRAVPGRSRASER